MAAYGQQLVVCTREKDEFEAHCSFTHILSVVELAAYGQQRVVCTKEKEDEFEMDCSFRHILPA